MPRTGQLQGTPARRAEFIEKARGLGPGDECIYWPWSETRGKYVRVYIDGVKTLAHRWVYEQVYGKLPERPDPHAPGATGVVIRHVVCSNRACVRPSHMATGDRRANIHDAVHQGRMAHGENAGQSKLADQQVVEIKLLYSRGVTQTILAESFGVGQSQISRIVRGENRNSLSQRVARGESIF
jgi:predicted XRE-type DNA-binding protein